MGELRKDYILGRYVIISDTRKYRPYDFEKAGAKKDKQSGAFCNFCPANQELVLSEILRTKQDGNWFIRVISNKYPVIELKGTVKLETQNKFYTSSNNYGVNEVIIETNNHAEQIYDLSKEQLFQLLLVYKERIANAMKNKAIQYAQIIKNHGRDAGASIEHSHSQLFAYNIIPTVIQQKEMACKKSCLYCKLIKNEINSPRFCFENNSFIAFAPYASRFAYELILFSKQHKLSLLDFNREELTDLAEILQKILQKLKQLNADFNFFFQNGIKNMHFHMEFTPRINIYAGFEIATDTFVNTIYPEDAAKWWREE